MDRTPLPDLMGLSESMFSRCWLLGMFGNPHVTLVMVPSLGTHHNGCLGNLFYWLLKQLPTSAMVWLDISIFVDAHTAVKAR